MHQPLHSVSGYFNDSRFGNLAMGDRGGNAIHVTVPPYPSITNLHALWDAAGGLYMINSPLSVSDTAALIANATELRRAIPPESLPQFNASDFAACWAEHGGFNEPCESVLEKWSNGSYDLATTVAYAPPVSQNYTVPSSYIETVQRTSRQQIALAGYRLASILKVVAASVPPPMPPPRTPHAQSSDGYGSMSSLDKGLIAALVLLSAICIMLLFSLYRSDDSGGGRYGRLLATMGTEPEGGDVYDDDDSPIKLA